MLWRRHRFLAFLNVLPRDLVCKAGAKGAQAMGSVPGKVPGALGMILSVAIGGQRKGTPSNVSSAGGMSACGGAGSGVRLALLMDPVVLPCAQCLPFNLSAGREE